MSRFIRMIGLKTRAYGRIRECEGGVKLQTYICYLNGKFYGGGPLEYMHELFKDYVITCQMYGHEECEFKIVKGNIVKEENI